MAAQMKTIDEALEWLNGLLKFGIKPGLERIKWLLEKLGYPERRLKTIHVAGTNGKGSTIEYLSKILMNAEQVIGTFTSPHISDVTDRIAVNGEPISPKDFVEIANEVRPLVEELASTEYGQATEFEVMTAIALRYFAKKVLPDIVIVETGLGGRFDSTNAIYPLLTIITNVDYDHTDILGTSIEQIAAEKAGIIKSGVPVITAATGEALAVIEKTAKEKKAKCYRYGKEFLTKNEQSEPDGERFDFQSPFLTKPSLFIPMKGKHQIENAALALMAVEYLHFFFGLTVEKEEVEAGLKQAKLKGRFEQVYDFPSIILDGAHNEKAAQRLAETISARLSDKKVHIVFASLETKNVQAMMEHLAKVADSITLTTFSHPKALSAEQLQSKLQLEQCKVEQDVDQVIQNALNNADGDTVTIFTGSLYFISEVRKRLTR